MTEKCQMDIGELMTGFACDDFFILLNTNEFLNEELTGNP